MLLRELVVFVGVSGTGMLLLLLLLLLLLSVVVGCDAVVDGRDCCCSCWCADRAWRASCRSLAAAERGRSELGGAEVVLLPVLLLVLLSGCCLLLVLLSDGCLLLSGGCCEAEGAEGTDTFVGAGLDEATGRERLGMALGCVAAGALAPVTGARAVSVCVLGRCAVALGMLAVGAVRGLLGLMFFAAPPADVAAAERGLLGLIIG